MNRFENRMSLQKQQGVVLLMSLIILVVMTVIGISLMGNSTLEERMAANQMNEHLILHASESATEIMVDDTDTLADALVSATPITVSVNVGDSSITAAAVLTYDGAANPQGWSMGVNDGSFMAHTIKTEGTATKSNANATITTVQGISRLGPKF
jgi:type IV pilus assembly protein PilX